MRHRRRRPGCGERQILRRRAPDPRHALRSLQPARNQVAHLERHYRTGQEGRTQIIRTGQGHLFASGRVFGSERTFDTDTQVEAARASHLFQTSIGRYVQQIRLN